MTHALGSIALVLNSAAAAKKQTSSPILYILLIVGAGFYFFIYRPQQKKQRAAQAQTKTFEVGDEVVTAGGIVGHVLDITDDRVTLETSVGASFTVLKPYILRKLEPVEPPADVVEDDDEGVHDHDDHDHDGRDHDVHDHDHDGPQPPAPPTEPPHGSDGHDDPPAGGADGPPII